MNAPRTLLDWQRQLGACVMQGDSARLRAQVRGDALASAARRIEVYGEAYRLRLVEVLANDYPVLRAWLGADAFTTMAEAYVDAHPSTTPSVRHFGRHLSAWLATVAAPRAQIELARFEWAQGEVFDAADAPCLTLAEVAALTPERWPSLALHPHTALRLLTLHGDAPARVTAHARGEAQPADVQTGAVRSWLLWRKEQEVHWRALDDDEAEALRSLRTGSRFDELCERLAARMPADEAALRAASLLKLWLHDGLLAADACGDPHPETEVDHEQAR